MSFLLLRLSLQSFFAPSCRIEVEGVRARVEKNRDGITIFNKEMELPEHSVWLFVERITELGVFSWECHHIQCCMLDGTSWTVEIQWDGKRLWSTGTNGYPPEWQQFTDLLAELLGMEKDLCRTIT